MVSSLFSSGGSVDGRVKYRPLTVRETRAIPELSSEMQFRLERSFHQLSCHVVAGKPNDVRDLVYCQTFLLRESRNIGKVREPVNVLRNVRPRQDFEHRLSSG